MMEANADQRGSLQNVATTTDKDPAKETLPAMMQTRSVSQDHMLPRYEISGQSDPRYQLWQCNSEVQCYEKYSHSINNENPHDLCSCYHTYEGAWGNYGKSWPGMETIPSYPSPLKHSKQTHTLQDNRYLPQPMEETNELDCPDWVYVNPYVCELPISEQICRMQKTQEVSSFSCYGSHQEIINVPTEKEVANNQTQNKEWYQIPVKESLENRTDNETEKSNDEYEEDVQSQLDSYLEWRNEGSSESNCATDITSKTKYICNGNENNETKIHPFNKESTKNMQQKIFSEGKICVSRCSALQDTSFHLQPVRDEAVEIIKTKNHKQISTKDSEQHNIYDHTTKADEETSSDLEEINLKENMPYFVQNIQNVDCTENLKDFIEIEEISIATNRGKNNSAQITEVIKTPITPPNKSINIKQEHQNINFKSILPYDPQQKFRFTKHREKSNFTQFQRKEWHNLQGVKVNEAKKSDTNKNFSSHIKDKTNSLCQSCNRKKKGEQCLHICKGKQDKNKGQVNVPFPSHYNYKFNKSERPDIRKIKTADGSPLKPELANVTINKHKCEDYTQMEEQCDRNVNISRNLPPTVQNENANSGDTSSCYEPQPLWEFRDSSGTRSNPETEHKINITTQKLTTLTLRHRNCILYKEPDKKNRILSMEQKKTQLCRLPSKRQKKVPVIYKHFEKNTSTDIDSSTPHKKTEIKKCCRKTIEDNSRRKTNQLHNPKQNKKKVLNVIWFRKKNSKVNESEDYPSSTDSETEENESLVTVGTNSSVNSCFKALTQELEHTKLYLTENNKVVLNDPHELNYETEKSKKMCYPLQKNGEEVNESFQGLKLRESNQTPPLTSMPTNDLDLSSGTENTVIFSENVPEKVILSKLSRRAIDTAQELIMQGTEENTFQEKTMQKCSTNISGSSCVKISNDRYNSYQCSILLPQLKNESTMQVISQKTNTITTPNILNQNSFSLSSISVPVPVEPHTGNSMKCAIPVALTTEAINTSLTPSDMDNANKKQSEYIIHSQDKMSHDPRTVIYIPANFSEREYLSESPLLEEVSLLYVDSRKSVKKEAGRSELLVSCTAFNSSDSEKKGQVNNLHPNDSTNDQAEVVTKQFEIMCDNSQKKDDNGINSSSDPEVSIIDDKHSTIKAQCNLTHNKECNIEDADVISGLVESTINELKNGKNVDARPKIHLGTQSEKSNENITDKSIENNDFLNKLVLSLSTNEEQTKKFTIETSMTRNDETKKQGIGGMQEIRFPYTTETKLLYEKLHSVGISPSQEETIRDGNLESNGIYENNESDFNVPPEGLSQNISKYKEIEETKGMNNNILQYNNYQLVNNNFYEHKNKTKEISLQTITSSEYNFTESTIAVNTNVKKNSTSKIIATVKDENNSMQNTKAIGTVYQDQNSKSKFSISLAPERWKKSLFYRRLHTKYNSKCKGKIVKEISKNKSTQTKKANLSKSVPKIAHSKISIPKKQFEKNTSECSAKNIFIMDSTIKYNMKNDTDQNDIILLKKVDYNKISRTPNEESHATPINFYTLHTAQKCEDSSFLTQHYSNFPKQGHVFPKEVLSCEQFRMSGDKKKRCQGNPISTSQTETSNISTQTDQYSAIYKSYTNRIKNVEASTLAKEKQKQFLHHQNKSCEEKLNNNYSMQNHYAMKTSLIQTAKEILRNDVYKLAFMQNYITVDDIPLSKMNILKEAAKELLTQKLKKDTFTDDNYVHSKAHEEEEKKEIEHKYVPQEKIATFKTTTIGKKIFIENTATAQTVPKIEFLRRHISEAKEKVRCAEINNKTSLQKITNSNTFSLKSHLGEVGDRGTRSYETRISKNLKSKINLKTGMKQELGSLKQNTLKHKRTKKKRNLSQILRTKLILRQMGIIVKDDVFETKPQMLSSEKFIINFKLRNIEINESTLYLYSSVNERGDAPNENSIFKLTYPRIFSNITENGVHTSKNENDNNIYNLKRIPQFLYSPDGGDSNKNYSFHQNFAAFHYPVIPTKTFSTQKLSKPIKQNIPPNFSSHPALMHNNTKIDNTSKRTQLLPSTSRNINNLTYNTNSSNMKIPFNSSNISSSESKFINKNSSENSSAIHQNQNDMPKLYYYKLLKKSVETTSWGSIQQTTSEHSVTKRDENLWSNCIKRQECGKMMSTTDLNKSPVSSIHSVKSFISRASHVSMVDEVDNSQNSTLKVGNINSLSVTTTAQRPLQYETSPWGSHPKSQVEGSHQFSKCTQTSLHSNAGSNDIHTQSHISNESSTNPVKFRNLSQITTESNTFGTQLPAYNTSKYPFFHQTPNIRVMKNFNDITMFSLNKPPENNFDPNINFMNDINIEVADGLKSTFYTKSMPPIEICEPCIIHISNLEPKFPFETGYTPCFIPASSQKYETYPKPLYQFKKKLCKIKRNQEKLRVNKSNSIRKYQLHMKNIQKKTLKHVLHKGEYIISSCCLQTNHFTLQQFQGKERYINKHEIKHDPGNNKMTVAKRETLIYIAKEQIHKVNVKEKNRFKIEGLCLAPFILKAPIPYILKSITLYLRFPSLYGSHASNEEKHSYFFLSVSSWRNIMCLITFLSLPFLIYTGSILSLALCKSQTCPNYWPLNVWDIFE